ncbi:MAG: hypothetical protein OEW83_19475 [Acidimicrobiia bacterium]|nr:hypothetical protein [Acidimicrobiia bacterium]
MNQLTPLRVLRRGPVLPGPYRAAAAHKPTLLGKLAMERWVGVSRSVDDRLKTIAQLRTSALIGCLW